MAREFNNDYSLSNEYTDLGFCIKKLKTEDAINKALEFYFNKFNQVELSVINEAFYNIFSLSSLQFSLSISIYNSILKFIGINSIFYHNNAYVSFVNYFKTTNQRNKIFDHIYGLHGLESFYKVKYLGDLIDYSNVDTIVDDLRNGKIDILFVEQLQYQLDSNPETKQILKELNEKINKVTTVPLPVYKDFKKEREEKDKVNIELLFNKDAFVGQLIDLFKEKEELTHDEIWNEIYPKSKNTFPETIPEVILNTVLIYQHSALSRNRTRTLEYVKNDWDNYSKRKIVQYLKQYEQASLTNEQIDEVTIWCSNILLTFDFKLALSKLGNNLSANDDAINVSYFIRKFNLNQFDQSIYLDMLLFQRWDGLIEIFDFVKTVCDFESIKDRVILDLKTEIVSEKVFEDHLIFCVENDLNESISAFKRYLNPIYSSHIRQETLSAYLKLGGDLNYLVEILNNTDDDFKHKLISPLIAKQCNNIENYLIKKF
jgi:hypothetical protein